MQESVSLAGEREVAKEHISIVVETTKHEKHLILFDRGYPSFQLISYLNAANASFLMRVRHKDEADIYSRFELK